MPGTLEPLKRRCIRNPLKLYRTSRQRLTYMPAVLRAGMVNDYGRQNTATGITWGLRRIPDSGWHYRVQNLADSLLHKALAEAGILLSRSPLFYSFDGHCQNPVQGMVHHKLVNTPRKKMKRLTRRR